MRVGLISDAHANVYGLHAALDALKRQSPEWIIFAGDAVGYYPFVNQTIDLLRAEDITCIKGNHDAMLLGEIPVNAERRQQYHLDETAAAIEAHHLDWLRALPAHLQLEIDGKTLAVYHGSPWEPLTGYIYPDHDDFPQFRSVEADFVVLGHTHWQMIHQVGGLKIVNPGSCGQPRDYQPGAAFALLDTGSGDVQLKRVRYDLRPIMEAVSDPALIDILTRTGEA